jgi:hypothetical protein
VECLLYCLRVITQLTTLIVGVDGRVLMLADFGEAACSLLLAALAMYCGDAVLEGSCFLDLGTRRG